MFNGKLKAEIASLMTQLAEAQGKVARLNEENDRLAMRLADKSREARTIGAALNEVIAERDALKEPAEAHNRLAGIIRALPTQFLAVFDQMSDEIGIPAAELAATATAEMNHAGTARSITPAYANAVQRALHSLGWAEFGTLYSMDDSSVRGRGYWLSAAGDRARAEIRADRDNLARDTVTHAQAA